MASGFKMVNCPQCDGEGSVRCPLTPVGLTLCDVDCSQCGGEGDIKCPSCNGKGDVKIPK